MLSAVGLSDIDCPCGQDRKSRRFDSDHQSTLVAIGIGRHVRVGSKADLTAPKSDFRFAPESGLKSDIPPCPFRANFGSNPDAMRRKNDDYATYQERFY
jgi:hypothetical protein